VISELFRTFLFRGPGRSHFPSGRDFCVPGLETVDARHVGLEFYSLEGFMALGANLARLFL
jgi:hypothetical protein